MNERINNLYKAMNARIHEEITRWLDNLINGWIND